MKKDAKYLVPNETSNGYDEVHFSSNTGVVEETPNRKYVTDLQETFLDKNLTNILLKENIANDFSTDDLTKVASAKTVKTLYELISGLKFVISDTQPQTIPGQTIVWIDTRKTED